MIQRAVRVLLLAAVTALAWPGAGPVAARPDPDSPAVTRATAPAAAAVNVAIQAGHWKSNELPAAFARLRGSTGAGGGGRTEAQVTVDIAGRVARILRSRGLTAEVLPATVPTGYTADLFISLHADGNTSTRPRGYKVSTRWRSEVAALDAVLVQAIEAGYSRVTGMPRDGSITRAMRGYYAYSSYRGEEYRLGATTPAAILEMGFMSNATDRAIMFNNPELVARGVVAGIDNFYARQAEARRLQAAAERTAAASPYNRSAFVLTNDANIRAAASTTAQRVAGAGFGDSFPLLQPNNTRPSNGTFDPHQGTQVVTGQGWYQIAVPGAAEAYISRDLIVVQQ